MNTKFSSKILEVETLTGGPTHENSSEKAVYGKQGQLRY